MRFSKSGDFEIVTRITGPIHHYLGLRFSSEPRHPGPIVEVLSLDRGASDAPALSDQRRIVDEVVRGVGAANRRLGTHYEVAGIRYCVDDSWRDGDYIALSETLVEHVARRDQARSEPDWEGGTLDESTLTRLADEMFLEYDAREAADAESKPGCCLADRPRSWMNAGLHSIGRVTIMSTNLTIEVEREDDGRWIAEVSGLPGVLAYGMTR